MQNKKSIWEYAHKIMAINTRAILPTLFHQEFQSFIEQHIFCVYPSEHDVTKEWRFKNYLPSTYEIFIKFLQRLQKGMALIKKGVVTETIAERELINKKVIDYFIANVNFIIEDPNGYVYWRFINNEWELQRAESKNVNPEKTTGQILWVNLEADQEIEIGSNGYRIWKNKEVQVNESKVFTNVIGSLFAINGGFNQGDYYFSFLHHLGIKGLDVQRANEDARAIRRIFLYPKKQILKTTCDSKGCSGGTVTIMKDNKPCGTESCKKCKGSGVLQNEPMGVILVDGGYNKNMTNANSSTDWFFDREKYLRPPVEAVQYAEESADKRYAQLEKALSLFDSTHIKQSGESKDIDQQNNNISSISIIEALVTKNITPLSASLLKLVTSEQKWANINFSINAPKDHDLRVSDYAQELKLFVETGAPVILRKQAILELLKDKHPNNYTLLKKIEILLDTDAFATLTVAEIASMKDVVSKETQLQYFMVGNALDAIVLEKSENWFMEADKIGIIKLVNQKAKEMAASEFALNNVLEGGLQSLLNKLPINE